MNRGCVTGAYLSVHTPRYCTLEAAFARKLAHPDFGPVRDGMVAQGRLLADGRSDVIIINSCHLITTFPVVVDGTPRHRGVLTAQEAPELIHGVEYDFPGDYVLASAVIERGRAAGELCSLANDIHYPLDYGTVMPLVCYLDTAQRTPVVPVSVCLLSDLDESFRWGRHIATAIRETGRGPPAWPAGACRINSCADQKGGQARATRNWTIGWCECWRRAITRAPGRGPPSTRRRPNPKWAAGIWR